MSARLFQPFQKNWSWDASSNQEVIPALKLSCDFKGTDIDFKKLTTQTINLILKGKIFEAPTS